MTENALTQFWDLIWEVMWTRYMGDRQWGFLGTRPVCDLLIQLDSFTG